MKSDSHIHSPFCPHGSNDRFEDYIKRALQLGLREMTFTEHAPLPAEFLDPTPDQDSGMNPVHLMDYIEELSLLKDSYKNQILIKIGLEVDFIEGFENETKTLLDQIGPYLDDSILSVHFIKIHKNYHCIDFSPDMFADIAKKAGSVDEVYERYFTAVEKSIAANLGKYKPRRIGHLTLVHKFQHQFPSTRSFDQRIYELLDQIQANEYELDYNGAGQVKPLCKEPYPPERFAKYAQQKGIPLIYGSDAHQAADLGQGYEALLKLNG
jgi:histidinol-phosphatase (PHP family)